MVSPCHNEACTVAMVLLDVGQSSDFIIVFQDGSVGHGFLRPGSSEQSGGQEGNRGSAQPRAVGKAAV